MMRPVSLILGVCLVVLGLYALGSPPARMVGWLDLVAAVGAFALAGMGRERFSRQTSVAAPFAMAVGLFALWVIAFAAAAPAWLAWWNFALGGAFALIAVGESWNQESTRIVRRRAGTYGDSFYLPPWEPPWLFPTGWDQRPLWGAGTEFQKRPGRGPRNYRRSDDRILENINDRLWEQEEIDASDVDVRVVNGEVTLTGFVDDRRARRIAEWIVDRVPGTLEVHNEIRVRKAGAPSVRAAS